MLSERICSWSLSGSLDAISSMRYILPFLIFQPVWLLSQQVDEIPNSMNQFGLDAGYELSNTPDYLISPASISTAIGMTYVGALGQTKAQIKNVFYYPDGSQFLSGFSEFIDVFNVTDPNTTISMANKLWAGDGRIELDPGFVQNNQAYFRSEPEFLDFGDSKKASQTINDWVAANTEDKVLNLIDPMLITPDAVLILTNAIYFKSNWARKFDPTRTKKGDFINDQKEKVTVNYMVGDGYYKTYENEYIDLIELPYVGEKFSFLILLPKTSVMDLEDHMVIENYHTWTRSMRNQKFEWVQVPKFKSSSKLDLKEMLIRLGMTNAFQGADFGGIGSADGRIELSAVVHQTFMEFNEEGTEAAAATGVVAVARSMPPPPKRFIANRPFIYILRHIESNAILFIGKMSNPKY